MSARAVLAILSALTAVGLLWNSGLTYQAYRDYKDVKERQINGARLTLAIARVRRHSLRWIKQLSLIGLWAPRVFLDHPSSAGWGFFCASIIVTTLTYETTQDWYDRQHVRWYLFEKRKNKKSEYRPDTETK